MYTYVLYELFSSITLCAAFLCKRVHLSCVFSNKLTYLQDNLTVMELFHKTAACHSKTQRVSDVKCPSHQCMSNKQRPNLQNILWQSYDSLMIMPKLWSTYDRRLICKTSHKECKTFLRYDPLAKSWDRLTFPRKLAYYILKRNLSTL